MGRQQREFAGGRPTVLYVSHTSTWGGGAEIVLEQMVRAARRSGFNPALVCPPGELVDRVGPRCSWTRTMALPQFRRTLNPRVLLRLVADWLLATLQITLLMRRAGVAVVHANSAVAALTAAVPAALLRRPLAWHQHDIVPPRRINRIVFSACARLTSAVLPCSEAVAASLRGVGVSSGKMQVVYNAVRPEFLVDYPDRELARFALDLPSGSVILTVVGRLVPRKGQDIFLRALRLLLEEGLDVHGLLLGSVPSQPQYAHIYGAFKDDLDRLTREPALAGRVTFLGHRDDVKTVLAASDVIVMPSFAEPFPLVILEAFAAQRPVVASHTGGHPETIVNGQTGYLAPVGDDAAFASAIGRLVRDPRLRVELAQHAHEQVLSEFSEETLQTRLAAVYEALLPAGLTAPCPRGRR